MAGPLARAPGVRVLLLPLGCGIRLSAGLDRCVRGLFEHRWGALAMQMLPVFLAIVLIKRLAPTLVILALAALPTAPEFYT